MWIPPGPWSEKKLHLRFTAAKESCSAGTGKVINLCVFRMVLSLYEYQILISLLEGSINTLNGLGWYHGVVPEDHRNAVKYFEQAALNGSADAMFNLGIYDINGKNPYSPFDSCTLSKLLCVLYDIFST